MYVSRSTLGKAKQIIQRGGNLSDALSYLRLNQYGGAGPFMEYYLRIFRRHPGLTLNQESTLRDIYRAASNRDLTLREITYLRDSHDRDVASGHFPEAFVTAVRRVFEYSAGGELAAMILFMIVAAVYDKFGIEPPPQDASP